jgi:hypothetical protein
MRSGAWGERAGNSFGVCRHGDILRKVANIASVEGLEGLTIGKLASAANQQERPMRAFRVEGKLTERGRR